MRENNFGAGRPQWDSTVATGNPTTFFDTACNAVDRSRIKTRGDGCFWRLSVPELDPEGKVIKSGFWQKQRQWWDLPNFIKAFVGGLGSGKCIKDGTEIYDPVAGVRKTVNQIGRTHTVSICESTDRIEIRSAASFPSGRKRCLRITARDGSSVSVSEDHRIYSRNGWVEARYLKLGDLIASPRRLPIAATVQDSDDEIRFISYLLADGGTTGNNCAFYKGIPEILADFCHAVEALGGEYSIAKEPSNCYKVGVRKLLPIVRKFGLAGLGSRNKRLPAHWYGFSEKQAVIFLRAFFACDAHFGERTFEVTLASKGLIEDIRHVLLLLGIKSAVAYKNATIRLAGGIKHFDAWRLRVSSDYARLLECLGDVPGRSERVARARAAQRLRTGHYHRDLVPISRKEISVLADYAGIGRVEARSFSNANHKQFLTRGQFKRFVSEYEIEGHEFTKHSDGDLIWSRISSIEDEGIHDVYDLSVEADHNFIAGNIVIHNTQIACKRIISLALENAPVPVAIVSPTFMMARRTTIPTIQDLLQGKEAQFGKAFFWRYNSAFHEFKIRFHGRQAQIMILSGERPLSLRGPNIAAAIMDEAFIHEEEVFTQLMARVRHPDASRKELGIVGSPEGLLDWGYDLCAGELGQRADVGIVHASTRENLALGPEYIKRLESVLTEKAAKAYIEGQFVNLSDGLVYYAFDPLEHVVERPIPEFAEIGAGMDFNVNPMAAAVFWRLGPHVHFFAEYEMPNADTEYMCQVLKENHWRQPGMRENQGLREIYPDASGRFRKTASPGGKSDFYYIKDAGFQIRAREDNPRRKDRFNAVNGKFRSKDGHVSLTISPSCKKLIKYLSTYSHEMMPRQEAESHILDSMSYPIAYLFPLDRSELSVQRLIGA